MKLTSAERTGLLVMAILVIAASIAIALFSHWERRLPISENTVPVATDSLISDIEAADTIAKPSHPKAKKPQKPIVTPRNPLDQSF